MRFLKNTKLIAGAALIVLGSAMIAMWVLHVPAKEITFKELGPLFEAKAIASARLLPTPYAGIYRVEATRQSGGKTEKIFVTTHLADSDLKNLFDQNGVSHGTGATW